MREASQKRTRLSAAERREVIERAAAEVFAERGYHGASIDEICRRSGVTAPVLYDHFGSKLALHKRLLERSRDELLEVWRTNLAGDEPAEVRIPRAIDAWAGYVQENPYVPRMFFAETTGDPEVEAIHREVQAQGATALGAILGGERGAAHLGGRREHEMAAQVMRGGLAGLAMWWADHPDVPREEIVAAALNVMWIGLDRVRTGETFRGSDP
jgi:AcrR family transcriptional regulator